MLSCEPHTQFGAFRTTVTTAVNEDWTYVNICDERVTQVEQCE